MPISRVIFKHKDIGLGLLKFIALLDSGQFKFESICLFLLS